MRERPSDIPLLACRFLQQFASAYGRSPLDISPASLERIEGYHWPGNVRELKNAIRRAAVYAEGAVVEIDEFLDCSRDPPPPPDPACQMLPPTLALPLRVQEHRWILEALARNHGNAAKAARELEIGEATVRRARRELTAALASDGDDIDQTAQELGISPSLIRTVTSAIGPSTLRSEEKS
ncbi:MAG: helix-turn-helix domain-containing protein [Gammaproteobacteria bacterium]